MRSFVRRAGRLTGGQERALGELLPRFGLAPGTGILDLPGIFGRDAPRVLEIGFGNGDALLAMAAAAPGTDFLGVEVHPPGVGHCLLGIERQGLGNVRVLMQDAIEVLEHRLPDASLAGVHLYFPDPWHKKRHHKRRIVQPAFVDLLTARVTLRGYFHVATDWPDYAEHIRAVMAQSPAWDPCAGDVARRPRTRFEARGERLGHPIWEGWYERGAGHHGNGQGGANEL